MAFKTLKNVFFLSLATGCGSDKDGSSSTKTSTNPTVSQLSQDTTAVATLTSTQVEAALNATGGGELNTGSSPAALSSNYTGDSLPTGVKTHTKSCVVEGQKAVVTRQTVVDSTQTRTNKNLSFTRKTSGNNSSKWEWSKEGVSLACNANGKEAQIPWANPENIVLVNTYSRSHKVEVNRTLKGVTSTDVREKAEQGKGTTKWVSATEAGGFMKRLKTVEFTATQTLTNVGRNKSNFSASLSTKANDPLSVEVTRDAIAPYTVKSRTIKSGTLVALIPNAGGSVHTSFSDVEFSVEGAAATCKITSGKFGVTLIDAGGTEVSKINCTVGDTDDISCIDSAGNAVANVEAPECDMADNL